MTTNKQVVLAFMRHKRLRTENLISNGEIIYSFGEHFPIAVWIGKRVMLVNTKKASPSQTTTRHMSLLRDALQSHSGVMMVELSTEQIREFIRGIPPKRPLRPVPESKEEALEYLRLMLLVESNAWSSKVDALMAKIQKSIDEFLFQEAL